MTDAKVTEPAVGAAAEKSVLNGAVQPARAQVPALLGALLIGLGLVVTLLVQLFSGDVKVSAQDLQQAAQLIREQAQKEPGLDRVVLVHPPWRQDLRRALHELVPKQRVLLAPPVKDGLPTGPLLVLRAGATPGPLGLRGYPVARSARAGALVLQWLRVDGAAQSSATNSIIYNKIKDLNVFFDAPARRYVCAQYDAARRLYRCPGLPEWNYVGVKEMRIADKDQPMIWAHPRTGATLNIEIPLPADAAELDFVYGLADSAASNPNGAELGVELLLGNLSLAKFVQHNARGLGHQRIEVPADAPSGTLRVLITCQDDGARHFGIDLRRVGAADKQEVRP